MSRTYLDIFFGALAAWLIWKHILRPKTQKLKAKIKDYAKHLKHIYNMNNDIYVDDLNKLLLDEMAACKEMLKSKDKNKEELGTFYKESQEKMKGKLPSKKFEGAADNLDVLLVAFSLAFAVRALFLQPFKIPTSSMQPTLHGINIYDDYSPKFDGLTEAEYLRTKYNYNISKSNANFRAFLDSLYYGQQYASVKSQVTGNVAAVEGVSMKDALLKRHGVPLLEAFTNVYIKSMDGGTTYVHTLPIQKQKIDNDKGSTNGFKINSSYTQGANIFTGVCEDGDHLFVNRLIYNLRNPKRGDISVFMTKGILDKDKKLRGQFYIKRLVGLPNETLRIKREPGQKYGKLFKVIDGKEVAVSEKDHPAFKKIYSGENGYHGHSRAFKLGYNWPTLTAQGDNIVLADTRFVHNGTEFIAESKDTTWFKHKLKIENDKFILYTSEEEVIFTNSQGIVKLTDIIRKDGYEAHFKNEYDEFKLGKDQFFMMGDNSDHSLDSRYWGPVPRKNLIGTAASVFWPFSHRWGMADNNKLQKIKTKQEGKF